MLNQACRETTGKPRGLIGGERGTPRTPVVCDPAGGLAPRGDSAVACAPTDFLGPTHPARRPRRPLAAMGPLPLTAEGLLSGEGGAVTQSPAPNAEAGLRQRGDPAARPFPPEGGR